MKQDEPIQIIVVGGGAGGLELATTLGRKLGKRKRAIVTLVDQHLTHLWKPLLHAIAAGTLDVHEEEINYLAHAHQAHYQFQAGTLVALNRAEKQIYVRPLTADVNASLSECKAMRYDYLVLAVGSEAYMFGIPGADQLCYALDDIDSAKRFHKDLLTYILDHQDKDNPQGEAKPSIVVIGGGATGVELVAELEHMVSHLKDYGLKPIRVGDNLDITLIESSDRILSQLPERIADGVMDVFLKNGVRVQSNAKVARVEAEAVVLDNGERLPATMVVWAAGIKAPEFLGSLDGLKVNMRNQIDVKPTLQSVNDESIFAIGDCSCCEREGGGFVPARAQAAHQQAELLAKSLHKHITKNQPLFEYNYVDYGSLISMSEGNSLGSLMGRATKSFFVEGRLARAFYLSLYKMHMLKLFGWWKVGGVTVSKLFRRGVKPTIKLH